MFCSTLLFHGRVFKASFGVRLAEAVAGIGAIECDSFESLALWVSKQEVVGTGGKLLDAADSAGWGLAMWVG